MSICPFYIFVDDRYIGNSMELVELSPVEMVIVTDSIPLPQDACTKIRQVPIADRFAKIIRSELVRSVYAGVCMNVCIVI